MLSDKFCHLKHVDGLFAAENIFQILIRVDIPLVLRILEVVLFNVYPKLLYNLRPWHRAFADYKSKLPAHIHWLHKSRIGLDHDFYYLTGNDFIIHHQAIYRKTASS